MDYYRRFERIVEQLLVSVGLPYLSVDTDIIAPTEEIRVLPSCQQPVGILPYILTDCIEFMVSTENPVIEISFRYNFPMP